MDRKGMGKLGKSRIVAFPPINKLPYPFVIFKYTNYINKNNIKHIIIKNSRLSRASIRENFHFEPCIHIIENIYKYRDSIVIKYVQADSKLVFL